MAMEKALATSDQDSFLEALCKKSRIAVSWSWWAVGCRGVEREKATLLYAMCLAEPSRGGPHEGLCTSRSRGVSLISEAPMQLVRAQWGTCDLRSSL